MADVDVVVVGAGFAGLGMAIALQQAGRSYVVLERAGDLGGVWRDNRYPGVTADSPAHLYSYSFEPNPLWSRAHAPGDEIQDYLAYCAEHYGVLPQLRFNTTVQAARFTGEGWECSIVTDEGEIEQLTGQHLVLAVGTYGDPRLPHLPGLESFEGAVMHTSSWDPAVPIVGEHIAVIGTGCAASQLIPQLVGDAAEVTVFQQHASWVLPHLDPGYADGLANAYEHRPWLMKAHRLKLRATAEASGVGYTTRPSLLRAQEKLAATYLARSVTDPALRATLTPTDRLGESTVVHSNDYLPALAAANVSVVSSSIESVTGTAVLTSDGQQHPCDVIVLATGFETYGALRLIDVRAAGGAGLAERFAGPVSSYFGVALPDLPNLFLLGGPNTQVPWTSVIPVYEAQIDLVTRVLTEAHRRHVNTVQVRPQVVPALRTELDRRLERSAFGPDAVNRVWPSSVAEYERRVRKANLVDFQFS
ncbi:cation diffusion facilitator CzcD-associated flavoprotein CzcO [Branchiibius hedensis]|uniref:Predicted flavoprotein CzcO associated with the cation diffusion facilitator CzcD n=1 Tax=Branchiibius hedensis TaxID=672460 RepID=A0A2Y9BUD2_9MICO|nr:NAD(P)/FAD-dependent oxidoreductase [Branchiibius hedensis]PWJ26721.1 cation diffusion facilitator CzcD-associated flavoprotein CzcO [Branchiibius hedensis]SSA35532.1 Predicted flavoprotein CzcO associated with the cation diffusion facilitator CzcD [Branchiibius hedensis]